MEDIHCPLCGPNNHFKVRYPERIDKDSLDFTPRKTPDRVHFRIVQCLGCGLVYSNPILPEEEVLDLYRQSGFIQEPQMDNMVEDYLEQVDQIIDSVNRGYLLEIGCSNGFFLQKAKRYGFKGVHGVEPNRLAVEKASPGIRDCIRNDPFRPGLFPEEHFDLICFFQVFDHILDPNGFLQTVFTYLKKGGMLLAIHHDIQAWMPRLLGSRASTYDISHIYLWDKQTMRKILEQNGFEVRHVKNTPNRYQFDHILRMLPLPFFVKTPLRTTFHWLRISDAYMKASVENMVAVARKNRSKHTNLLSKPTAGLASARHDAARA